MSAFWLWLPYEYLKKYNNLLIQHLMLAWFDSLVNGHYPHTIKKDAETTLVVETLN